MNSGYKIYATEQYVDENFARKSDIKDTDLSAYETKEDASAKLDEAKEYTDNAVEGKADTFHTHDDRYYTENEVNTKLAAKSDTSHKHDSDYDAKGSADTALASAKSYANDTFVSTEGATFEGNIKFTDKSVGIVLQKTDGSEELIQLLDNGLVVGGSGGYTNVLPKATDADRVTIYNGIGYKKDTYLAVSGMAVADAFCGNCATGFIPVSNGDIIRIKNIGKAEDPYDEYASDNSYIIGYDASNTKTYSLQWDKKPSSYISSILSTTPNENGTYDVVITLDATIFGSNINAVRISGVFDATSVITVNETFDNEGFHVEEWTFTLADGSTVTKKVVLA